MLAAVPGTDEVHCIPHLCTCCVCVCVCVGLSESLLSVMDAKSTSFKSGLLVASLLRGISRGSSSVFWKTVEILEMGAHAKKKNDSKAKD